MPTEAQIDAAARGLTRLRIDRNLRLERSPNIYDEAFVERAIDAAWRNWVEDARAALTAAEAVEVSNDDTALIVRSEGRARMRQSVANKVMLDIGDVLALCALARRGAGRAVPDGGRQMSEAPKDGTVFVALSEDLTGSGLPPFFSLCAWHQDAGFCTDELREPTRWWPINLPDEASIRADERERCAVAVLCHADDRLGRDRPMDWHDGYIDGCLGAAAAIRAAAPKPEGKP